MSARAILVGAWLAALAVAGSCSINHRSDQLACTNNNDCAPGGRCEDNVCTNPNGGFDAPPVDPPEVCPDQCTSCDLDSMLCRIDCGAGADCTKKQTCPSGWNCDIRCSGQNDCRAGVDCQKSKSCNVTCSGEQSCRSVGCGAGPCNVDCSGDASCRNIACGNSCRCDVSCSDFSDCQDVFCPGETCEVFGGGCSSQFIGCSKQCP